MLQCVLLIILALSQADSYDLDSLVPPSKASNLRRRLWSSTKSWRFVGVKPAEHKSPQTQPQESVKLTSSLASSASLSNRRPGGSTRGKTKAASLSPTVVDSSAQQLSKNEEEKPTTGLRSSSNALVKEPTGSHQDDSEVLSPLGLDVDSVKTSYEGVGSDSKPTSAPEHETVTLTMSVGKLPESSSPAP